MNRDSSHSPFPTLVCAVLLAATTLGLTACTQSPPETDPVAVWDGGRLERNAFEAWAAWQDVEPSRTAVRKLALVASLADAAKERGLGESQEVQLAIEVRRQSELLPALERHLDGQVTITDAEIDELRATYPDAFHQPRKLFLRGIYKRLPDGEQERAGTYRQMRALRARVVEGGDLGELARRESDSQSRYRDGSVGFVDPASLPGPVRHAVENLDKGEVSPVIELADGLAFYRCERIKPARIPDADEVRHKFRQNLFRQRSAERKKALQEALAAQIRVTPDEDPVLAVGDYVLPADGLDDLARWRIPGRDPAGLTAPQKHRLLTEWGQRVARADHAASLGLVDGSYQATASRWHRAHALATAELRSRVDSRLRPASEAELRALYEQRKDRLNKPRRARVAVIQFADAESMNERSVLENARDVVNRIQTGEVTFEQAARDASIHVSAGGGGHLGWVTIRQLGSLDVRLLKPLRSLSPGEDSGLLRLQSGLWLVKLLDREAASPMTFEQARPRLEEVAKQEQVERLESEVREQELARMDLKILAY